MNTRWSRTLLWALVVALGSFPAFAQGTSTSSLSGLVVDSDGRAVPGATVTVKNTATGTTFNTASTATGDFTVPAVPIGTYSVTVALPGFKTAVLNDVPVSVGVVATVRAVLEVGSVEETVTVQAAGALVQTQSTTISSTISTTEIANTPLVSRNVLDFVTALPGVNTPGGNRNSTINGLPQSSINITLDGINIQDNTLKTGDGFFAIVNPRLDAIEEVTVSGAAQTADSAGTGAVQIRFVTRSGSNSYTGSAYNFYRNDALNENTYFNTRDGVAKAELLQNQPGFRLGGPIVLPGLFDGHNRAFFFVNYEEFRQPAQLTRERNILSPEAQAGIFRYRSGGGITSVNLYELAAANGIAATPDPTIGQLLADIRAAAGTTGSIDDLEDPNIQRFRFNVNTRALNRFPTVRLDYNITEQHRVSTAINYQKFSSVPDTLNNRDPFFPGFPIQASQGSTRIGVSGSLRSTLGASVVNELRVGGSGAPVEFFKEISPAMYNGPVANQGGFLLGINNANITNAGGGATPSSRNAYTWLLENTLNWQKGAHGLNLGGSYSEIGIWLKNQQMVPNITLDVLQGTAAKAVFGSTANLPGSSATNRGDAEDLYAVLVGSVSAIDGDARINASTGNYEYLGQSLQEGKLRDIAFWGQDAWRPRPDLTINLGVRWELQTPFRALNDSYSISTLEDVWGASGIAPTCTDASAINPTDCNLFKPGFQPGKPITQYYQFDSGTNLYDMDWDNIAPSVGLAWTPSADIGLWARFLGRPGDTVFRAGWSRSYQRNGMGDITGAIDDNPGLIIQDVDRTEAIGNVLPAGADVLLFRDRSLLGPAPFPASRIYPMTDADTQDVDVFDPSIQVPYADTWSAGWQRALSRHMAMEIRYVGTRSRDLWALYNYNELNITENGVLDEFRRAQQNLQANIAAGRGANFRYFGPGTGTSPLPIALGYFSGLPADLAGDPTRYGSGNFASSTFVNPLASFNPNPFGWANSLDSTLTLRNNGLAAGLPANFLVANPNKLGGAQVTGNGGYTNFHSAQFELRRRMANGLQFNSSYVFGRARTSQFFSFRVPRIEALDGGGEGGVTHAVKANWIYELPIGQGRRFASNAGPVLDRIIGGWQLHGVARLQSGQTVDFGTARMVGFDLDDLKDMYFYRRDADGIVTMLPEDVIENTVRAFSVSATSPTGYSSLGAPEGRYFAPGEGPDCIEAIPNDYGSCSQHNLQIDAPWFKNVDLSVVKLVPVAGRVRAELRLEMLNAFNTVNFVPVTGIGTDPDDFEVTNLNGATVARVIQIVTRVTW